MKVLVTGDLPDIAIDILMKNKFEVIVNTSGKLLTQKQIIKKGKDCDAIISLLADNIDRNVILNLPKLKIIANYAVGYNNIDIKTADEKNICVTNTPGVLTESTADLAMTLVLACARRVVEGERMVRHNKFKGWMPKLLLGLELQNKTFGIIGAGRIGSAVASRALSFGTKIIYFNRSRNLSLEEKTGAKKVTLHKLLNSADIISIHLPLNEKSKNLLGKNELALLKKDAILVNTARGEIVDETALIETLKKKKIFSAGFDVYVNEPKINKELYKLDNVVLLPHLGSATIEARNKMAVLAANNVVSLLKKKQIPQAIVNNYK